VVGAAVVGAAVVVVGAAVVVVGAAVVVVGAAVVVVVVTNVLHIGAPSLTMTASFSVNKKLNAVVVVVVQAC